MAHPQAYKFAFRSTINNLKFKRLLDAKIDNAKLEKWFKTARQLDLTASELAISIRIVYDHIIKIFSVINNDYGALYLILVQQTVNFKKAIEDLQRICFWQEYFLGRDLFFSRIGILNFHSYFSDY